MRTVDFEIRASSQKSIYLRDFFKDLRSTFEEKKVRVVTLPIEEVLITVNKAPSMNKKAREQFVVKKYRKVIFLRSVTLEELEHFLRTVSESVAVRVQQCIFK